MYGITHSDGMNPFKSLCSWVPTISQSMTHTPNDHSAFDSEFLGVPDSVLLVVLH
jgi:hypothetical protein